MDVFTGQMTSEVLALFMEHNICIVNVPPNMTKYYQPLDLTVNGYAKRFTKNKFNEWYAQQITKQLQEGNKLENVDVKLRLSTLKPLHAGWLVALYNEMTSAKGKEIISSGWRAAGIKDAVRLGLKNLPTIDPFHDIDPLLSSEPDVHNNILQAQLQMCWGSSRRWKQLKILTAFWIRMATQMCIGQLLMIDQFADVLNAAGVLDKVRKNKQLCEVLFTHSPNKQLIPDAFMRLVATERPTAFGDRQSYDWFMQFIQDSEEKRLHGLLQFITSFRNVPPLGLPHKICLKYLSEEDESATLPTSIACLCILSLPTVHSSKAKFEESVILAIDCESQGFGSV
eukprot:gene13334-14712_t